MLNPLASGDGWSASEISKTAGNHVRGECVHQHLTIGVMLAGSFQYESEHFKHVFFPGSALVSAGGQRFACEHDGLTDNSLLLLRYSADNFERLALDAGAPLDPNRILSHALSLPNSALPLIAEVRNGILSKDETAWDDLSFRIGAEVMRALAKSTEEERVISAGDHRRIALAVRFIEAAYQQTLTLAEMAAAAALSPYHFLRRFRQIVGMTPHQFLIRKRLQEAAISLRRTHESITSIALRVGFGDLSNFTRTFRHAFGVSPGVYRTMNRGRA